MLIVRPKISGYVSRLNSYACVCVAVNDGYNLLGQLSNTSCEYSHHVFVHLAGFLFDFERCD